MTKHLWRGQWVDDAELAVRLPMLGATLAEDLECTFPLRQLLTAAHDLGQELRTSGTVRDQLHGVLMAAPDAREQDVAMTLDSVASFLDREQLEYKLKRELGSTDPFTPRRISFTGNRFESWAPLGFLVHVAPGNVSSVAPLSVIEGMLSGNINFLKTSSGGSAFAQHLLATLVERDPSGALAPFVYAAEISSRETDRLRNLFSLADGIAAWGGEAAIAAVRDMAPQGCRVIDWGHKISFAYLAKEKLEDIASLQALARDVCFIEQQACSSPQCLFIEAADREDLFAFAEKFSGILGGVSEVIPVTHPGLQERAEITTVTEAARMEAVYSGSTRVFAAPDNSWRVLAEDNPALRASPLYRTLWVKPLAPSAFTATLRPMRPWLQTAGLACNLERYADLSNRLIAAGISRVTQVGEQLGGYVGAPHDGVYALQRYCRRISCELPANAKGIASFHELTEPIPPLAPDTPLLDKAGFLALEENENHAHLYFKSGGSSGAPKLAVYSWTDYHSQMQAAADGLYAAGLDPTKDRTMNLFFSGHLYGSFISFWSVLENLGAVQFPITGIDDMEEVANTIINQKVDTLLGMPFYIHKLFSTQGDMLRTYGGVKKIFFGGEHFNSVQRKHLQREFGVEIIRAAAYGSNDAGPLGYQCEGCDDSEYHVLTQTQYLEILDTEADRPATAGEPGRLAFTSLARRGQKVERYEIGDMGRWLTTPCSCGRSAPRFELMGRYGDMFRAPYFFNYRIFCRVLAEHGHYTGNVQLVLNHDGIRHNIKVWLEDGHNLASAQARSLLLTHYPDLRDFVEEYGFVTLTVEQISLSAFATTPSTGKLKAIVDLRSAT
ncbi:acyl-CoA reductase [Pseudochelatococcus sp. G4_1912]|uniref:acyl-CoA reductase n=1 Tax=Pseudochelatococcus sp. G4_1912 TaxID=3114288 RepID=UPI0039C7604B